jgi:hypothetical protein
LLDVSTAQAPEDFFEPYSTDRTAEYIYRIADLEGRLDSSKKQTTVAMRQAEKSAALSQKVSLLEDQVSALIAKVVHLEECDLYMIEVLEAATGQLSCKLSKAPCFRVVPLCCSHPFFAWAYVWSLLLKITE